jgi:hypothetical protein
MKFAFTLASVVFIISWGGSAQASFVDDGTELSQAIPALRSAIGNHPRILRIEVEPNDVIVEAQDPNNLNHVNRWRYVSHIGILPIRWVFGPEPVDLQLLNPDLEANLFDLDTVTFSATTKLGKAAIEHARLQDAGVITRMEIERQTYILPKPSSGDVRWTLHITSGREQAEVYANAHGDIIGADLSSTHRAQTLNLYKEPELVVDAAAAFRDTVGADPVLTSVIIDTQRVSFLTNIADNRLGKLGGGLDQVANYGWNLEGLHSGFPGMDSSRMLQKLNQAPTLEPFSVNDVDWTIVAKLEADSLAKVNLTQAQITGIKIERSSSQPGQVVLAWTIKITDAEGEDTSVVADTKGAIQRVLLPESRRPKLVWTDPATLANAISRIGTTFGPNTKIVSIVADDRGGRITIDDPASGGNLATFNLGAEGVSRASMTFALNPQGPRFGVADVALLTQQKIAALEADAMKRFGRNKQAYLESISIGAHLLVQKAGARAIEVRLRDIPQDSAKAEYAWIVYDFEGRALDFSGW